MSAHELPGVAKLRRELESVYEMIKVLVAEQDKLREQVKQLQESNNGHRHRKAARGH